MTNMAVPPVAGASVSAARAALRRATHAAHVRLNRHPLLSGMLRPGYSLDDYRRVLVAYFHFYRAIELVIDEAASRLDSAFSYQERRKLPWLATDLSHFGIDPDAPSARPQKPPAIPTDLDSARLFGVLYTIEGSTLGGRVLARHLSSMLGLTAESGGRFFAGYGEAVDNLWLQFTSEMDLKLADGDARLRAGIAATQTFSALEQLLDEYAGRRKF